MLLLRSLASFFQHPRSRAVGLIFATDGLLYGSWSALIPYIKTKFGLDAAQLGLLLFCLPLGVTVANLLGAWLIRRYGMRQTTMLAVFITAPCFLLPMVAPTMILLAVSLFICGLFFSILNVAMNTCATALENKEGLRIMSTCHGMWSLGAMTGSALGGMVTGWGIAPALYMTVAVSGILLVGAGVRKQILAIPEEKIETHSENAAFIWPNRLLWGLIILSLCTNLAEGTMADWAAVYMREIVQAAPWLTGYGFAAYAFWMAAGRFTGDILIHRYGSRRSLQVGGAVVAGGLIVAVLFPYTFTTLLG
ncbi:MAG: MFS transporter, partial [Saprospiraceae bacterium]